MSNVEFKILTKIAPDRAPDRISGQLILFQKVQICNF
jgi:hypothetical protein